MTSRTLLAGPILRRAEPGRVCVWAATSAPVEVAAEVHRIGDGRPALLGAAGSETVQLGPRLFAHLVTVEADAGAFPTDTLLGYDLVVDGRRLADLELLEGPRRLIYDGLPLPTFFLRRDTTGLHLLHGSCRLLHGQGEDAMVAADRCLQGSAHDLAQRPSALLLTGDQVYGDEVAGAVIGHLRSLATELCGERDATDVPGIGSLAGVAVGGRAELVAGAGFTSGKAANHLLSFGEYAAMYLMAWDEDNWPAALSPADEALPDASVKDRRRYEQQAEALEVTRAALPAVRRVLANCPTYMVFDDHDVTDDWNLTAAWRDGVRANPTGRRIIANALAAFWAFQGWGNDPDLYDSPFRAAVTGHLSGAGADGDAYDQALWAFDRWSYVAPTNPPTVMLDTRTQRSFDDPEGAARLLSDPERARIVELCRAAGHQPGQPLILVSAVPVYGLELQERRQKFLVGKVGPYEIDFEAWHSNLHGLLDFMRLLITDLDLPTCTILSGDVHYGITIEARFAIGERILPIAQLVSSSFKHSGTLSRLGIDALGTLVGHRHHRVGWDRPPDVDDPTGLKDRVLNRAANTDEWDPDSPVFVAPRRARQLAAAKSPDYREMRRYAAFEEHAAGSVLVGANNVGLVTIDGSTVTHRLLTPTDGTVRTHTATITLPTPLT